VSLYNETDGNAILPAPVSAGVGLIDDVDARGRLAPRRAGLTLVLVGETLGWLGASLYLREVLRPRGRRTAAGRSRGRAPQRRAVRTLIDRGLAKACHDVSDGGLLVAVAEMALVSRHRRPGCDVCRTASGGACALVRRGPGPLPRVADDPNAVEMVRHRRAPAWSSSAPSGDGWRALTLDGDPPYRWTTLRGPRRLAAGASWPAMRNVQRLRFIAMPMPAADIETPDPEALPDARSTIEDLRGDGDHYAATS
jgi:hypothetical protein